MPPSTCAAASKPAPASCNLKLTFFCAPHELHCRLYVPGQGSALESISVPHYLQTKINSWNKLDKAGFLHLHCSVLNELLHDNICITGESDDDQQVACCADVSAGTRRLRCLLLYFDHPEGVSQEAPLAKWGESVPPPDLLLADDDFACDSLPDEEAGSSVSVDSESVDYVSSPLKSSASTATPSNAD